MAFPATPSNNQVHKEGDRSYVYDSALGTWDRIPNSDTVIGQSSTKGFNGYFEGRLTDNTTFPSGHIIQVVTRNDFVRTDTSTTSSSFQSTGESIQIVPKILRSKILVLFNPAPSAVATSGSGATMRLNIYRSGSSVTDEYIWGHATGSDHTLSHQYMEAAPRTWNAQVGNPMFTQYFDEPRHSNITDKIKYEIYIRHLGGHSTTMSASQHHHCGMTLMEVMHND